MSLKYIKDFTVKTKAVYRCSCGATVIADKAKVESGERTGCRICDNFTGGIEGFENLNNSVKKRVYNSKRYSAGMKVGVFILTGNFINVSKNHRHYEVKCECGRVDFYTTSEINRVKHSCVHLCNNKRLKTGDRLGVYEIIGKTDKRVERNIVYKFKCTVCNKELECLRRDLGDTRVCSCNSDKKTKERAIIGKTYGVYDVLDRVYSKEMKCNVYKCKCNICEEIVLVRNQSLIKRPVQCRHKSRKFIKPE